VKATVRLTLTHNPWGEAYWASGLRENLTSRSSGEGRETGRRLLQAPRQSFTRQRTFAWLLNDRRHSRDYERLTTNSEAMIQLNMIRLLLKRLA
jgi:transposase